MLSLSDICEEEEEQDDDEDNDNGKERDKNNMRDRRIFMTAEEKGNVCPDEITRLLIGHPDGSFYPDGDTCDSIRLTQLSHCSIGNKHRDVASDDGCSNYNSVVIINHGDNGNEGHRHALGELRLNNGAKESRNKIPVNANEARGETNGKVDIISLTDEKSRKSSVGLSQTNAKKKEMRRSGRRHHSVSTNSNSKDVKKQHSSSPHSTVPQSSSHSFSSSLSSSSPNSPIQDVGYGPTTTSTSDSDLSVNTDSNSNFNSNGGESGEFRCKSTTSDVTHPSDDCSAVSMEISKTTSICLLVDGEVLASCPLSTIHQQQQQQQQLQQQNHHPSHHHYYQQQREFDHHKLVNTTTKLKVPLSLPGVLADGLTSNKCHYTNVEVLSSPATTTPSDSLSPSSSSTFSTNHQQRQHLQNAKSDDVTLPPNCRYNKKHQTLIPIQEIKRSLTRKQFIQLSVMTGIGFIFVAFIILWLMSPVLF